MGGLYTLNGAVVATKGGNRCGINCEAYGSPVAWNEELPNQGGKMQFIVWGQSACEAAFDQANNGRIELNYGKFATADSPWNAMVFGWANREIWGAAQDDITSTPAVFALDDQRVDTTRIVTLSEGGALRIDRLKMVGGAPQHDALNQYTDLNMFGVLHTTSYPVISPVIYRDPYWGDGPDNDVPAMPDDYAFVPQDHLNVGGKHVLSVRSYDLHETVLNQVPRYGTQALVDRHFTMSTPAIVTHAFGWQIQPGSPDPGITPHPWKPNPNNPFGAPVFDGPSWVNPVPQWPPAVGFVLVPATVNVYMLLVTVDDSTNPPTPMLTAFDIDTNHLINGNTEYPMKWDVPIQAVSNSAVAASDNAVFWHPPAGGLGGYWAVDPIASLGLEDGNLAIVSNIMTATPHIDYVALDVNTPSAIRSTPSFADGHIIAPWSDQTKVGNPAIPVNTLKIDIVDLGAAVQTPAKKFATLTFQGTNNKVYQLDRDGVTVVNGVIIHRGRDLVTASGLYDNSGENGQRHYYIGVRDQDNNGPHVGLLWIDWAWLKTGVPGQKGFTLAQSFSAIHVNGEGLTDWLLYSSPALVSENEANSKNYVVLGAYMPEQQVDWTDPQPPHTVYHFAWTKEGELFTFNS